MKTAGAVTRAAIVAALLIGFAAAAPIKEGAAPHAVDPFGPTIQSPTGTSVLPNGRLVTPAGSVYNTGLFPLGVAVSPDGRFAVTVNSGLGAGLNFGFGSFCENSNSNKTCPYLSAAEKAQVGNPSNRTYDESLSVLDLATGAITEVKAAPTATNYLDAGKPGKYNFFFQGGVFSADGRHFYASGGGNRAVYDFAVSASGLSSAPARTVAVPDTFSKAAVGGSSGPLSPDYPIFGAVSGFTRGLAVTRDGAYVLVAHEFNDSLDIVRTQDMSVTQQVPLTPNPAPTGGAYPYTVVVDPNGQTAYVSAQGLGEVAVVTLDGAGHGLVTGVVPVGDHPTALAMSPDGSQLYVANADSDTLDVVDTTTRLVGNSIQLHAVDGEQLGSTPNAIAVAPDGQRLYVALAGDDAVAVLGLAASFQPTGPGPAAPSNGPASVPGTGGGLPNTAAQPPPAPSGWTVGGFIPSGWYPSALATSPDGSRVYIVSAKGVGSRYIPPFAQGQRRGDIRNSYEYDGSNMPGLFQSVQVPTATTLNGFTTQVRQNLLAAAVTDANRSPHNPIPATPGGHTPITHVIEVVRENRTFDEEYGDLGANTGRDAAQVDGRADYVLFGKDTTPNGHALAGDPTRGTPPAYATADNFYSDGEASIQGHWWTTAATVNDYVEKSYPQYYSNRNHVYDPESTVSQPKNCTIFQSAAQKLLSSAGSFSFRNYGELIGLLNLSVPGIDLGYLGSPNVPNPCATIPNGSYDPNAAMNEQKLDQDGRAQATEFLKDSGLNTNGSSTGRPQDFLRSFSYLVMGGDHTGGLGWAETPRARVAENDGGLGLIVQALSHSQYWDNTAILVMEDDSQDGLDHQDGHRNILFAISPYAKHVGPDGKPGYIGHRHYSQASVMKTIELFLGLPYMSTYDQNASPLFDLFQDKDSAAGLTPTDLAPYTAQPMPFFVPEPTSCYKTTPTPQGCPRQTASAALAANLVTRSDALDLSGLDRASRDLNVIDWQLAHPDSPVPAALLGGAAPDPADGGK